jgi:hypothetical protein
MSTKCGLGCLRNKAKHFFCTKSQFFSGLMTAQAVDPLPLYRGFLGTYIYQLCRAFTVLEGVFTISDGNQTH